MTQDYRDLLGTDLLSDSRTYINETNDALRTDFAGATEPSSPAAYQTWKDTTTQTIKQRNSTNDAWIVVGLLGTAYGGMLPLAGGTMTGAINMGGQQITNVGLGTGTAVARQQEVDLKAPLAAPALTGDATVNQDPAGVNSLIRRSWAEGRYAKTSGAAFTGALTLGGYASGATEAVPKSSIEDMVTFNTSTGHNHDNITSRPVKGEHISSASGSEGQILRATAAGYMEWKSIPRVIFGVMTSTGTVQIAGSGDWTPSKWATGVYRIYFSPVVATLPVLVALCDDLRVVEMTHRGYDYIEIKTYTSGGTPIDIAVDFAVFSMTA